MRYDEVGVGVRDKEDESIRGRNLINLGNIKISSNLSFT